jgi:proline dehydrogenase
VATHNVELLTRLLDRLDGALREVELLLGLPGAGSLRVAAEHGIPVRFYVAYGSPGLAFKLSSVGRRNQRLRAREASALRPAGAR